MNSISFVGRLGRDAELKELPNTCVLEFTVANNTGFGEKKSTNWFKCSLWGKQGENMEKYLQKGKQVAISGELTLREYTTKDGEKRLSAEVRVDRLDLIGSKEDDQPAKDDVPAPAPKAPAQQQEPETEEDMPF